jgi:hypothetical protein
MQDQAVLGRDLSTKAAGTSTFLKHPGDPT